MTTTEVHRPHSDAAPPPTNPWQLIKHGAAITVIALVTFVTGAVGLIYEYLLSTTSSYLLGSSMEQYSITIGLMLGMMGVGGLVQSRIPDRRVLPTFIVAEFTLALLGGFAPLANVAAFGHLTDHYALVQYSFIMSIGLLIGIEIPLAARLQSAYISRLGVNLGWITFFDYVGSFIGAVTWVKLLHLGMPITKIGFMVAVGNVIVGLITLVFFQRQGLMPNRRSKVLCISMAVVSLSGLSAGITMEPTWSAQSLQALYEDPVVFSALTPYQQLVVTERPLHTPVNGRSTDVRLYINGNTQFSSVDENIYHESLVHPAMSLSTHHHVLILGGGDGLALREVLKYPDVQSVTLVDLDPEMIRLASTNPIFTKLNQNAFKDARVSPQLRAGLTNTGTQTPVLQDTGDTYKLRGNLVDETRQTAAVSVYTIDAAKFVQARPEQFDTIIVDLTDPSTIEVAKLYSREFYAQLRGMLTVDGVMVVQSGSPYHANLAYNCVSNTLQAAGFHVLPYHTNVPSFGDWGWNLVWKAPVTRGQMLSRINQLPAWSVPTTFLVDRTTFISMLSFGKGQLDPTVPDSTLTQPHILGYYVRNGWEVE